MGADDHTALLVPVGTSVTLRNTVAYAVRIAQEEAAEAGGAATVHFVYPAVWRAVESTRAKKLERSRELLDRVEVWAEEDLDPDGAPVSVETAVVGVDEYLFSSGDFARVLTAYAEDNGLNNVVVDPEFQPGGNAPMLAPLEFELRELGLSVEEAPVERSARRTSLVGRESISQFAVVFGASFGFYLLLGGNPLYPFELVTGAITATVVAAVLSQISVKQPPNFALLPRQAARLALFVPYLLWEIAKANVAMAYVVLHPSLPIDPSLERFEAAVWGDLPATTLANSITLTPGTLTVDVVDDEVVVHALTADTRAELEAGSLARAVAFVTGESSPDGRGGGAG